MNDPIPLAELRDRQRKLLNETHRALPDTDPEAWTYGAEFIREGRIWRVSVICNTFIIGTAIDAQRDSSNEVVRHSDLIMVKL